MKEQQTSDPLTAAIRITMNIKREGQLREAWIKNVSRICGYSEEEARSAYYRIQPYNQQKP